MIALAEAAIEDVREHALGDYASRHLLEWHLTRLREWRRDVEHEHDNEKETAR